MRLRSVYAIECLCGRYIETEETDLRCPECKRQLVIEWGQAGESEFGSIPLCKEVRSAA